MFNQSTMLRCALLCVLFFFPIQAAQSSTLSKPLIAPKEQRSDDAVTISIEDQAYHRTLLLVSGYIKQHHSRYMVNGLKKIIADYAYEAPLPAPEGIATQRNKCYACLSVGFCTTLLVGVMVACFILQADTQVAFDYSFPNQ